MKPLLTAFQFTPKQCMPIVIFSCVESLYLVQCSHLEHFYRFFKSGIPEKPYFIRGFSVVPIISLSPTKNTCRIFPVYLFSLIFFHTIWCGTFLLFFHTLSCGSPPTLFYSLLPHFLDVVCWRSGGLVLMGDLVECFGGVWCYG